MMRIIALIGPTGGSQYCIEVRDAASSNRESYSIKESIEPEAPLSGRWLTTPF